MENKIKALTNIETFYHDVRVIVGYYDGRHIEDWEIKQLQRVADCRYSELLKEV